MILTVLYCAWAAQATTGGATEVTPRGPESPTSKAAEALVRGDVNSALQLADKALAVRRDDAWAHYIKAAALATLDRVDESVAEYEQAAGRFGANDRRGRSVAIWGRARVLDRAGRCAESARAFREYADLVRPTDADSAATAEARIQTCKATATATQVAPGERPVPLVSPAP